jgi:hypothetical protein
LLFLDPGSEIRDPGWLKIRIRDKHPGSATLEHKTLVIYWQDGENDELFISMVDDTTERKVTIPAAFLLGKNG